MDEQLYCGVGKYEITPPPRLACLLPGLGPQKITGILDPLYARVMIFKSGNTGMMLISVDLDKAPNHQEFLKALSDRTGIPEEAILYFSIHTHTAPVMGYRPFENLDITKFPKEKQEAFAEYTEIIKTGLLKAAEEAVAVLQPARVGWGHGKSYININRCCQYEFTDENAQKQLMVETGFNGEGPVDRDVFLMRVEGMDGTPLGFFINYALHNVVMFLHDAGDGGIHISHDVGGCVSCSLEKRFPGTVAVWSSGAAGNINPIMAVQNYFPKLADGSADLSPFQNFEAAVELRNRLAGRHLADVLEINRRIVCETDKAEIEYAEVYISVPEKERRKEEPWSFSRIRLKRIQAGAVAFIGVNGELFSTLGDIIKKNAPVRECIVINHECSLMLDNPGYILDDETNQLCERAALVRMPHDGFKAHSGYLEEELSRKTEELFMKSIKKEK